MKKKVRKRLSEKIALIAVIVLVLCLLPTSVSAANVEMQAGAPIFIINTSVIGFAGQEWWVIGDGTSGVHPVADHVTLLAKSTGNPYGNVAYNLSGDSVYPNGGLHTAMTSIYGTIGTVNAKEQALITARIIDNIWDGSGTYNDTDTLPGQYLWPLSLAEWNTLGDATVRSYGAWWWLRSPPNALRAIVSRSDGSGYSNVYANLDYDAVRPALNLNLTSVLFSSAASGTGAKSAATIGGGLVSATAITGVIKLTIEDPSLALTCSDTAARTVKPGDTVDIIYSGATTGPNNYVSCVIANSGGDVLYYGKLADTASGTASFTVPAMVDGNYSIRLFSEEANGDNYADFASLPVDISLTVDSTAPILIAGTASRSSGSNTDVSFTSSKAGDYSYIIRESSAAAPTDAEVQTATTTGTMINGTNNIPLTTLAGDSPKKIYIMGKDAAGNWSNKIEIDIPAHVPPASSVTGGAGTANTSPQTGDDSNLSLLWFTCGVSGMALAGIVFCLWRPIRRGKRRTLW